MSLSTFAAVMMDISSLCVSYNKKESVSFIAFADITFSLFFLFKCRSYVALTYKSTLALADVGFDSKIASNVLCMFVNF